VKPSREDLGDQPGLDINSLPRVLGLEGLALIPPPPLLQLEVSDQMDQEGSLEGKPMQGFSNLIQTTMFKMVNMHKGNNKGQHYLGHM
jgi:hypothetical protein